MRIGLISPPWLPVPPTGYGGTESYLDRLARGLVAAGHDVQLAATDDSTCPVPRLPGFGPSQMERIGEAVVELSHVTRAYAAMAGVDVIHDHTLSGPVYRHRPRGVPVVTTNHGPFEAHLGDLYRSMRDVSVIAISHHQASTARGVHIAKVIHHGLDAETVPVGTGAGGYACFLGRMHPDKGVREAVQIARSAGVPLRIAAKMREKIEQEYFEDQVKPLLGGDIEYIGEVFETEKYELLGGSIALLNPIQWAEPFGLVMIEALATGTPIIATPVGSVPEIVDDARTGFLRRSIADLAAALVDAPSLSRAECRRVAVDRFSTERMVEKHVDLYARVMVATTLPGARLLPPRYRATLSRAPVGNTGIGIASTP